MAARFVRSIIWLLLFRSGPQDVPYSPYLVRLLIPLAVAAAWFLFSMMMPPTVAIVMALVNVFATLAVAEGVLRARKMPSRAPQTIAALLGTGIILNLLMIYPASILAPDIAKVAKHPDLLKSGAVQLPQGAVLIVDALNIWQFAVAAYIYKHAANVRVFGGIGFALLASIVILVLAFVVAGMLSAV